MSDALENEIRGLLHDDLQALVDYLIEHLSSYRSRHVFLVARYAYKLAQREFATQPTKWHQALVAALIHDITKEEKKEFHYNLFQKYNLPKEYFEMPKPIFHSKSAPLFALEKFGIDDKEIADAAAYHTTGKQGMSKLCRIVFAADMLGSKPEDEAFELFQKDLHSLCLLKVKQSVLDVLRKGLALHQDTVDFYNELVGAC